MRLATHQPNFIPRLKVLQKIASADCWVVLDGVQFAQREWQNRARIATAGRVPTEFWLTLPVRLPNGRRTLIEHVVVCDLHRTLRRCRNSVFHAFRSAPHWEVVEEYWNRVESSIASDRLLDVVLPTVTEALKMFAVLPPIIMSSRLSVEGRKSWLMANLCRKVGATVYLADSGATAYLDESHFVGATVMWQNWDPPGEFQGDAGLGLRDLAFICYLAYHGPERVRDHLQAGKFGTRQSLSEIAPDALRIG